MDKTLGLIGTGKVVQNLFQHLLKEPPLSDQLERILVYNSRYINNNTFCASSNYQQLKSVIKVDKITLEAVHHDEFSRLIQESDVVIDARLGYYPKSLLQFALECKKHSSQRKEDLESTLDSDTDYELYLAAEKEKANTEKGRRSFEPGEFKERWQTILKVIKTVDKVSKDFWENYSQHPFGARILDEFPANVPLAVEQGKILQGLASRGFIDFPLYLNILNEPCFTSDIMVGHCPTLASSLAAVTGVDLVRLDDVVLREYQAQLAHADFQKMPLAVSLLGIHDTTMMIPVVYPQREEEYEHFRQVLNGLDLPVLFDFLKERVGKYFEENQLRTDSSGKHLTSTQVSKALAKYVLAALESRGKALTPLPGNTERPYSGGYFHAMKGRENGGMFLVGNFRFLDGLVEGFPIQMDEYTSEQHRQVVSKKRELLGAMCLGDHAPLSEIAYPLQGKLDQARTMLPYSPSRIFVAGARKEQNRRKYEVWATDLAEISFSEVVVLPPYHYTHMEQVQLSSRAHYLVLAYEEAKQSSRQLGLVCYNLSGAELKVIPLQGRNFSEALTSMTVFPNKSQHGEPTMVISQRELGVVHFSLADIARMDVAEVLRHPSLSPARVGRTPLVYSDGTYLYTVIDTEVFRTDRADHIGERCFQAPEPITAMHVQGPDIWMGTTQGKIFQHNNSGSEKSTLFFDTQNPYPVHHLQRGTYLRKQGVFYTLQRGETPGNLYFSNGKGQVRVSATLDETVSNFYGIGNTIFWLGPDQILSQKGSRRKTIPGPDGLKMNNFYIMGG